MDHLYDGNFSLPGAGLENNGLADTIDLWDDDCVIGNFFDLDPEPSLWMQNTTTGLSNSHVLSNNWMPAPAISSPAVQEFPSQTVEEAGLNQITLNQGSSEGDANVRGRSQKAEKIGEDLWESCFNSVSTVFENKNFIQLKEFLRDRHQLYPRCVIILLNMLKLLTSIQAGNS
jgi:hypothetical protein